MNKTASCLFTVRSKRVFLLTIHTYLEDMMILYLNKLLVNFAFVNSVSKIIQITGLNAVFEL